MAIAGRVAIVPKGDWSADATYKRLDAVTYNNTLYFAKKEVPAGTATSNTEYWSKSVVGDASAIATTEDAGIVKPDGKSMSVDENGTLSINLDGTTITLDEAKNVIKLADALKDKIGSALQPESIVNNQVTTETGFALDARQANPNVDGTLAKQLNDIIRGQAQVFNPVLDLNDFFTGIGIFNEDTSNTPAKEWLLVISAGPNGTRLQIAWTLFGANNYFRYEASGTWGEWKKLPDLFELYNSFNDVNNFKFRKRIETWSSASQITGGCGIYHIATIEDNYYASISKNVKVFQPVGDYELVIFMWNGLETLNFGTGLLMSPRSTSLCLVQVWEGAFTLYDV